MANAQLSVKCRFCGSIATSGCEHDEDSPVLEIDFHAGEIRYICKHCKKDNSLRLVVLDTKKLPGIRRGAY